MARLYSTNLILDTIDSGSDASYDVEDGFVVVIRDISATVINPYDAPGATWWVAVDGLNIAQWYYPPDVYTTEHWEGRVVAPGPLTITADSDGDVVVELAVSGYLLTLP
jgi:hypothetical protein